MRVSSPFFCTAILAVASFSASNVRARQGAAASAATSQDEAHVLITISAKKGTQIPPARKSDISVSDNKETVAVDEIRPVRDDPLIFSVLVDGSGSMQAIRAKQTAAAVRLFRALAGTRNEGHLFLFKVDDEVDMDNQVVDASAVEQALRDNDTRRGPTILYDAIAQAVKQQLALPDNSQWSRRALFLITDGEDNFSHASFDETLSLLDREGIPVFAIYLPDPNAETNANSKQQAKEGLRRLRELCRDTGGDIAVADDLENSILDVLGALDEQYRLSFAPFPGSASGLHSLRVKCSLPACVVSAPARYPAP